jgi:hypothetical protein
MKGKQSRKLTNDRGNIVNVSFREGFLELDSWLSVYHNYEPIENSKIY